MAEKNSEQVTYSAAQLRESLPELDNAHPHAGMVQDTPKRKLISYLATVYDGDVTDTEIFQDIVRNEATESLTDAVNAGNVSEMQFAVGMVNHSDDRDQSWQAWLRDAILSEAYVGWVTGGMGSGKTDFALDRADDWHHATRGRVATNIISAAERNDPVEYVASYDELETFFKESRGDAFYVVDETDQELSGKGTNAQNAEKVADILKLIRKGTDGGTHNRGILLIGQTVRGAAKELRRLVTTNGHLYHKADKKTVEIYDDVVNGEIATMRPERTISGIRKSRWSFNSGEASDFDMSEAPGETDGLSEWDKDVQTAIRAVVRREMTYREVAELVDWKKDWVGERVREWRRGDHAEAVGFGPDDVDSSDADV